jgi:hypothetical protein
MAGVGFTASIAALVAVLQGSQSPSGNDGLWVAMVVFLALGILGAIGWWMTKDNDEPKPERSSVKAHADNQSRAIAAGRDVTIGQYHEAPAPPKARPTPSFDLQHKPNEEGWVHLALVNFAEAGTFHVDVTLVEKAKNSETTPYSVKWRGYAGEDRQVVKESLIDLAHVGEPWYEDPDGYVVTVTGQRKVGGWFVGRFTLYSFEWQGGWDVEAEAVPGPQGMPERIALYLEEIVLHVCAVRIDTKEEVERVVTIGFNPPEWSESGGRWETPRGIRVQVD